MVRWMEFRSVWGFLGARGKFSQTYQKNWLELRKWGWFYVTQKSPGIEGKISLGSNGTALLVRFFHGIGGCRKDAEKPGFYTGSLQ